MATYWIVIGVVQRRIYSKGGQSGQRGKQGRDERRTAGTAPGIKDTAGGEATESRITGTETATGDRDESEGRSKEGVGEPDDEQ